MKRRTLDILFSIGGLALAALLLVAGIVLTSNANFANTYVRPAEPAEDHLQDRRHAHRRGEGAACLVKYAGQPLTTGKQAECYANNFIGLHLQGHRRRQDLRRARRPAERSCGPDRRGAEGNAPNLADLQKQLDDVTRQRETVFKGETLRGLLLTSYGFSEFGTKAGQAATVAYLGRGAAPAAVDRRLRPRVRHPRSKGFAVPEQPKQAKEQAPAG